MHVTRPGEAFMSLFAAKLLECPDVSELNPVPDAYTPIIKVVYRGVDIDLLYLGFGVIFSWLPRNYVIFPQQGTL